MGERVDGVAAPTPGPVVSVNPGGLSFDLRKFPKDDLSRFKASVLNGKGSAMPAWSGKLSDEDIANLWAYVKGGG